MGAGDSLVSVPDSPPKRKGGSGEYSTSSHYVIVRSRKEVTKPFEGPEGRQ